MAQASLPTIDERRRGLSYESGVRDAGGYGENRYSKDQYIVDGMPFQQTHIKQVVGRGLTSAMSEGLKNDDDAPSQPISVPMRSGQGLRHYEESRHHEDAAIRPRLEHRLASIQFAPRVQLDDGDRPPLEERLPKLSINTRPRGRSMMDELAKQRSGSSDSLRKERSAVLKAASAQETVPENAIATSSFSGSKYSSPPIDELLAAQEQLSSAYASPVTYTPMTGSPTSAASSWLGQYSSRIPASRRRSQRSGTGSMQNSPAATFLRAYSGNNASSATQAPDAEGQEIADYLLGKEIGKGGFSIVREAFSTSNPSSKPTLAVKIIRKRLQGVSESDNEEIQALVDHEMQLWQGLEHENILRLHELYSTMFATYAFMPLAPQGSLFDAVRAVRNVGLELEKVRSYAAQVAEALRYLHRDAHVAHRDVKLENCLIMSEHDTDPQTPSHSTSNPRVVLADFGLANYLNVSRPPELADEQERIADAASSNKKPKTAAAEDKDGGPPGSLHYAAPELLNPPKGRQPPLSTRPDIWAFGVMLFAMVTGKRPFADSFEPKLVESIKAGAWDRVLLDERIRKYTSGNQEKQLGSDDSAELLGETSEDGAVFKVAHECKQSSYLDPGYDHTDGTSSATSIMANEAWARSCNTIIVSDGIDPENISEVVKGCLTTNPDDRWDITRIVESTWLAGEQKYDD